MVTNTISMTTKFDVAIVGAGMAGASLAAELAPHARVLLLEQETMPGYHTTGRSAAFWSRTYGGPLISPLTQASGAWLQAGGFLRQTGELIVGRADDAARLSALIAQFMPNGVDLVRCDPRARVAGLRPDWCDALIEPGCADIDVAALHAHYLSTARRAGAVVMCNAPLRGARRDAGSWQLMAGGQSVSADTLINAAGAWADPVAALAGVPPLRITPLRRTMVQLRMAQPLPRELPLVIDVRERVYFKAEGRDRIWLSPHDETPSPPCDAAPEEIDVATAIARFEELVDWPIAAVERKWAGLRSFALDRLPVYGFDAAVPGFFWFAGQGGFGIQTAPAAAKLAAALVLGVPCDPMVAHLDADRFAPRRFA